MRMMKVPVEASEKTVEKKDAGQKTASSFPSFKQMLKHLQNEGASVPVGGQTLRCVAGKIEVTTRTGKRKIPVTLTPDEIGSHLRNASSEMAAELTRLYEDA